MPFTLMSSLIASSMELIVTAKPGNSIVVSTNFLMSMFLVTSFTAFFTVSFASSTTGAFARSAAASFASSTNVTMQRFYLERENQLYLMQLDDDFHRMFFEICNKMQCYCLSKEFGIHFDRVRFASLENLRDNKTVQDHSYVSTI